MLFNLIVFIWVIVILIRHTRGTAARKKERVSNKTIIRLMISIGGVMFLFGLTWIFAIFTFTSTGDAFQVLFTLSNSFQGFCIFLFFCVFNKEALESWKEFFSCGKYTSKLLHPSQVKLSSTALTKKPKQTKSESITGLGSSSGGKYNLETSKSDYDSSTLKGITYEKPSFESKVDLGTHSTIEKSVVEEEGQTQAAPAPECSQTSTVPVVEVESIDLSSNQNRNAGPKKKNKVMSLKARIKRYSTKKTQQHHVEEIEVDFDSDQGSQDGGEEENAITQV